MREEKYTAIKWICGMGRLFSLLFLLSAFALGVSQLNIFLGLSGEEEAPKAVFAAALSSRQLDRGLFGNIRIESQEQVSLSRAFLLINGEQCGDFSQGQLSVRVYPGDVLRVDASAYLRELYFSIVE
ncbi:MAG: hypothetical protein Q4B50_06220, partial [Bacillota bacterium]|nr:hypothetical protein [Bacillota bacterium]